MAHYGTLRNYEFNDTERADDIRGSNVYGRNDEKLGKIDDVIFDHNTGEIRYAVIDTGGWLSTKKFIIPRQQLRPSTEHENDFAMDVDKKQIEAFPPYDEEDLSSQDRWGDYEKQYEKAWTSDPVQHREGSDHNITPTAQEMPEQSGSIGSQLTPKENRDLSSRIIPAGSDDVTISNSAVGIGDRWLNFESRLRQRRRDIVESCASCTIGPAADRSAGSVENERKAV